MAGWVPDLRRMPAGHQENFDAITRGGAFERVGMPRFDDVVSEEYSEAIQAYIIDEAIADKEFRESPALWRAIKEVVYDIVAW